MLTVSQLSKSFAGRALFSTTSFIFFLVPRRAQCCPFPHERTGNHCRASQAEARGASAGKGKLKRLNAESPIPQTGWGRALLEIAGKADDLPADLSLQHDHYLYGTPKR
jgi:hypothetical protein